MDALKAAFRTAIHSVLQPILDEEFAEARKRFLQRAVPAVESLCGSDAGLAAVFTRLMDHLTSLHSDVKRITSHQHALNQENKVLREKKAALEAMHAEGLFAFARGIDPEARRVLLTVLTCGDVAKAARDLGLKDSTLRSRLKQWPRRGKAYAALAEIIRWRASVKGRAGIQLAKQIASGADRDVDFPALVRDVVEELEELSPDNWEERCGSLAEALRKIIA